MPERVVEVGGASAVMQVLKIRVQTEFYPKCAGRLLVELKQGSDII